MADEQQQRWHEFHAEAEVLKGKLQLPLEQEIKTQTYAQLAKEGGYRAEHENDYRLENVITYSGAHTHVAGNPSVKPEHGWITLASSIVENLNVLNVVTADRVVAQVSLTYPRQGYVPAITFLGTRFDNLQIAGHPVKIDFDFNIFGPKPDNGAPYTKVPGFLNRVAAQHARVRAHPNLLEELFKRYTGVSPDIADPEAIECSLVNQASGNFPGQCHGHVIQVPDFGTIILGAVCLEQSEYDNGIPKRTLVRLNMIELKMGCVADGEANVAGVITNGTTRP
jgi:hypothetical protein